MGQAVLCLRGIQIMKDAGTIGYLCISQLVFVLTFEQGLGKKHSHVVDGFLGLVFLRTRRAGVILSSVYVP